MERSKAGEKESPDGRSQPNLNKILMNIMYYFLRYGNDNEIQLIKNKMDLNN